MLQKVIYEANNVLSFANCYNNSCRRSYKCALWDIVDYTPLNSNVSKPLLMADREGHCGLIRR